MYPNRINYFTFDGTFYGISDNLNPLTANKMKRINLLKNAMSRTDFANLARVDFNFLE